MFATPSGIIINKFLCLCLCDVLDVFYWIPIPSYFIESINFIHVKVQLNREYIVCDKTCRITGVLSAGVYSIEYFYDGAGVEVHHIYFPFIAEVFQHGNRESTFMWCFWFVFIHPISLYH